MMRPCPPGARLGPGCWSHPILLGGPHEHGDVHATARGKQPALLGIVLLLVHEAYVLPRQATGAHVALEIE